MKVKMLGIVGAVLLVAALFVGLTGVVLADEQTWYLNDATTTPGYEMDRAAPSSASPNEVSDYILVADSGSEIWIANEAAQVDVYFCAATWKTDVYFKVVPTTTTDGGTVYIGIWDGSNFTSKGSTTFSTNPTGDTRRYQPEISAIAFTVSTGDWLAFVFDNNTGASVDVDTGGDEQSRISGPTCDPGYPTPELSTIILTGAGLAALGGFVWLRRRKGAPTQA